MSEESAARRALRRLVALEPGETAATLWSFAYFFSLLAGYYVLRPLRDEMGIAGGVRNLQWMFTATFAVMLAAVPLYGWLVAAVPRRRFVPLVYHFLVLNIGVFWVLMTLRVDIQNVARVFFVWISVFNLFAVSVFWSFMADLFTSEQGKRLFGFIAAGGSAGALLGPVVTIGLVGQIGPVNLLLVAAVLLEIAVFCATRVERTISRRDADRALPDAPDPSRARAALGGGGLAGLRMVLRTPYLAGIAAWVALLSVAGTFLYLQQATIVAAASGSAAVRTAIFATIDLVVGILTILVQFFATGRLVKRFGVGTAAAALPLVFAVGFLVLGLAPTLLAVIAFQAVQRTVNFAVSNPAREVLFTVLSPEAKYKAKNVIDTVVFRGSDAVGGWLFAGLRSVMELPVIALISVPLSLLWLVLAHMVGRAHETRAAQLRSDAS